MPNKIERTFADIISSLPDPSTQTIPDWPIAADDTGFDIVPLADEESGLYSYDEMRGVYRAYDRMADERVVLPPSQDGKDLISGGVRVKGLDAIAFYKSIRFIDRKPFPGKWGIFYLKDGLDYLAWAISEQYPGYKDPRVLAHDFLYAHEHMHFRLDVQTLMFESAIKQHRYLVVRKALKGNHSLFVEEAIANNAAYAWAKRADVGLREFADDFMSVQPGAYGRFDEPLVDLAGEWASNVVDLLPPGHTKHHTLAPWVLETPKDFMRKSLCPEYVIVPEKLENWLSPAWVPPPVRAIEEDPRVTKDMQSKRFSSIVKKWDDTKRKMLQDRTLNSLNLKKWPKDGPDVYSVKVDDGWRAHLRHLGEGLWLALRVGNHKEMGHG